MRAYEAIIATLENIGVETIFGGAGKNAASMMLALSESDNIRTIITKNEQAASFMACGYAMFSGKLGVCFASAGAGAFNLVSGLSVALTDSYPVLAISGYAMMSMAGKGALNETTGLNRTPDSRKLFDAITKANFFIKDINEIESVMQQAIDAAFDGRPGPVHVAIADDVNNPSLKLENFNPPTLRIKPVLPDPGRVVGTAEFLADAISKDKKIVMLAGYGAIRAKAYREICDFIERYQIPLVTTLDGKGIVDESHPLTIGVFSDSGHKSAWELFLEADVVIAVGNSFNQHATFDFRADLFEDKKLVQINIDPVEIDKVYKADHAIVGDARLAVSALSDAMAPLVGPVAEKTFRAPDYDEQRIVKLSTQLHPGELSQSISKLLPENGVVLADAGAHAAWLGYYLELKQGQNFRKPGTFGPMGIGVNGSLGVKIGAMDRPVVAAVGDGSYLMSGFELMTAVEHDIPVVWVIFNDSEFRLIKLYQLSTHLDSGLVEFNNPDYVTYARACGADGYKVDRIDDFEDAYATALASGRPTLIDAEITRLAVPNYSPHPEGVLQGIWEGFQARFSGG